MIRQRWQFAVHGAVAAGLVALMSCAPTAPKGVDKDTLDDAVGTAIGDAGTCAVIVQKGSGKTLWRYGRYMACDRDLPSCVGQGTQTIADVAKAAAKGGAITASCNSVADGSRMVGWASGTAGAPEKGLAYAAVIESDRGLPGREVKVRIEQAFGKAGL
jgi:hypothetical protein